MPTVLRADGFRFFFFSREGEEPPHVHVEHAERYAKFWLHPVSLASSSGFRSHELTTLLRLVEQHQSQFEEAWNEHFSH
jgi:hypothetical protein